MGYLFTWHLIFKNPVYPVNPVQSLNSFKRMQEGEFYSFKGRRNVTYTTGTDLTAPDGAAAQLDGSPCLQVYLDTTTEKMIQINDPVVGILMQHKYRNIRRIRNLEGMVDLFKDRCLDYFSPVPYFPSLLF